MLRLIHIEWLKVRHYRAFWVLFLLYLVVIVALSAGGGAFLKFIENQGANFRGFSPTMIPIYAFPDVWQNLTYFVTFFKVFFGFIVVITIANEYSYRTLRQNIIDGMSRADFIKSKLGFIFILCLVNVLVVGLTGLILGFIFSPVKDPKFIFQSIEFLAVYLLDLFIFSCFAFLVGLLLKRSAIAIMLLSLYVLFIEPFIVINLENIPVLPAFYKKITPFFPVEALNNLIQNPFPRYMFREIQNYVGGVELAIALAYLMIYLLLIRWLINKRDL